MSQSDEGLQQPGEAQAGTAEVDPWAAAFAAVGKKDEESVEEPDGEHVASDADGGGAKGVDAGEDSGEAEAGNGGMDGDASVGFHASDGTDGAEDGDGFQDDIGVTAEEIESARNQLKENADTRAIEEVAKAFVKRGVRNSNGRLGATINDPDICKRDEDGVARFYNPDTGQEFTGDNPRRQAKEWVDDYNKELEDAFNRACSSVSEKIMQSAEPSLKVLEFAPKYEQLDPVRRSMFDSLVEDYQITDSSGEVVGYSCDLDKALAAVNRQVRTIQASYGGMAATKSNEPTGPALDIKSSPQNGKVGERPEFKSLAEAMEWEQDRLLEKARKGM